MNQRESVWTRDIGAHFFSSVFLAAVVPLRVVGRAAWSLLRRLRANFLCLVLTLGKLVRALATLLTPLLTSFLEKAIPEVEFFFFLSCLLCSLCFWMTENTFLNFFFDFSFLAYTLTAPSVLSPKPCYDHYLNTWWGAVEIGQAEWVMGEWLTIELDQMTVPSLGELP